MSKADKRRRAKERRRRNDAAARAAEARRKRLRTVAGAGITVLLIGVVALLAGGGLGGSGQVEGTDSTLPDDPAAAETAPSRADTGDGPAPLPAPPPGATMTGATECPPPGSVAERVSQFAQAPPTGCIDPSGDYTATVETSKGSITVDLTPDQAPVAVNNFVVLARYRYFDGLPFHRVAAGFVDQTGSSGIPDYGSGGPGYTLPDEAPDRPYETGDVAMARAEEVSGSQFFFTLDPASLNGAAASYPLIGTVTEGMEVVEAINALAPASGDGPPTEVVSIASVRIAETDAQG